MGRSCCGFQVDTSVSCWLTSSFPQHCPSLTPGDASSLQNLPLWPSHWFLVYPLPSMQAGKERSRWDQSIVPEISQKHLTLDFKLEEEYLKRASWNWFLNPPKATLQSIQSVTYFPASKSNFIKRRKCSSVFMMGRMGFFALNIKGKTLLSVLIGDPGEQDIREDCCCCCTDLRKYFFFFFLKPVHSNQRPLARQKR